MAETMSNVRPAGSAVPHDLAVARAIWPLLLAGILATVPMTAISMFTPAIAADLATSVAVVGGLRIVLGVAALLSGALFAPLIDQWPRAATVAVGLVGLALATVMSTQAGLAGIAIFYALAGAAGAVLQPALQSAAADGLDPAVGARAASLLSGVMAMSAMLVGPLLALAAGWWAWRGDFLAVGGALMLVAAFLRVRLGRDRPAGVARPGYLAAFRLVATAAGAPALLLGSLLRAGAWYGWIAFLPAYYADTFGAGLDTIGLLWSLAGGGYFVGNQLAGRLAARGAADGRAAASLLLGSLLCSAVLLPASLLAPSLPLGLLAATLTTMAHGAAQGSLISLLVRRYTPIRGAVMGLNAAGFNLGTAGAVVGGLALGAGYGGLAAVSLMLGTGALATTLAGVRRLATTPSATP